MTKTAPSPDEETPTSGETDEPTNPGTPTPREDASPEDTPLEDTPLEDEGFPTPPIRDGFEASTPPAREALERHGLPWLEDLCSRQSSNLDTVIAVTGEEGVGKSTLALQLALRFDADLSVDQIHFEADSFLSDAGDRPEGSTLVLDEAFEGAFSRRSMSHESVNFVKFLGEARALQHNLIICFPRFANLDDYLRNHRVAYRIRVPERGEARVYEMRTNPFADRLQAYPVLRTAFRFGPMEDHPIWDPYMEKKLSRIRDRTRNLGKGGPTGLTMGAIKNAVKTGHLTYEKAVEVLVHDNHVRDTWAAEVYLNAYLDEKPPEDLPHPDDVARTY